MDQTGLEDQLNDLLDMVSPYILDTYILTRIFGCKYCNSSTLLSNLHKNKRFNILPCVLKKEIELLCDNFHFVQQLFITSGTLSVSYKSARSNLKIGNYFIVILQHTEHYEGSILCDYWKNLVQFSSQNLTSETLQYKVPYYSWDVQKPKQKPPLPQGQLIQLNGC